MSGRKHIKTQYPGVYYRESAERMAGKIPDRTYEVCYRDAGGKLCWHTVGRHSNGIRPAYANQVRGKLLEEVAAGKNPATASPTVMERAAAGQKPAAAPSNTVGAAGVANHARADPEGKPTGPERNRYELHLKAGLHALPVMAVTPQILIDAKQRLAQTLGDQSLRHAFGFLRRAINHIIEVRSLGIANPFSVKRGGAFRLPRAENAAVRFLTPDEAHALLGALKGRSRPLPGQEMHGRVAVGHVHDGQQLVHAELVPGLAGQLAHHSGVVPAEHVGDGLRADARGRALDQAVQDRREGRILVAGHNANPPCGLAWRWAQQWASQGMLAALGGLVFDFGLGAGLEMDRRGQHVGGKHRSPDGMMMRRDGFGAQMPRGVDAPNADHFTERLVGKPGAAHFDLETLLPCYLN